MTREEIDSIGTWASQMRKYPLYTPKQKMKLAKSILKLRYKMIGSGLNRMVFDLDNGYVLKVAFSGIGLISNKQEYNLYHSCKEEVRQFLCPVFEMGEGWIIMKKMDRKASMTSQHLLNLIAMRSKFYRNGILPVDLRFGNVALSQENKMLVIDYGLFITI
ncbi:hypothetical protein JOC77_001448 [Peribacillus deserti]|uniref:Serine/threonine protein kinase n=1 Tax=Peribacillus deserti TaxID=673318 RepID=A0ABS2QI95_9BACI|nr:hypothetical protein [Peribacillus deserti]MBM7692021.1 hypothetical protein [Peribacillus deserti]